MLVEQGTVGAAQISLTGALARMAVGVVLPAVIYLIENWEAQVGGVVSSAAGADDSTPSAFEVGEILRHETFGEGQVLETAVTPHGTVATVDFGPRVGRRRILLHG